MTVKDRMTHPELIIYAVSQLRQEGKKTFSRQDIRSSLGINPEDWSASYNPVIQAMRVDQPGGAPIVKERFRNVLKRTERGKYILTEQGEELVDEMLNQFKDVSNSTSVGISLKGILDNSDFFQQSKPLLTRFPKNNNYDEKVKQILFQAETYHLNYYRSGTFGNPCLYFHLRALNTRQNPTSIEHLEYVYATLIAWGMNRLGRGGSKLTDFDVFLNSIKPLNEYILEAQDFDYSSMDQCKWDIVEKIFREIRVMDSGTSIVGNSKAMHHMLPNIIPPVDRTYTLSYLFSNTNIRNDLDYEWHLLKEIITSFFIPIASDYKFKLLVSTWMHQMDDFPWDTSQFKVIDNLIVGYKQ